MKKIVCALLLLFSPCIAFCQYFVLTPNGIRVDGKLEESYIVLNFSDKSQSDLYELAHGYIVSNFNSAKDVMSESSPNYITVNARFTFREKAVYNYQIDALYNYKLAFKDGKVKVEFVLADLDVPPQPHSKNFSFNLIAKGKAFGGYGVFSKKGDVASPNAKQAIEEFANALTKGLVDAISGESEW